MDQVMNECDAYSMCFEIFSNAGWSHLEMAEFVVLPNSEKVSRIVSLVGELKQERSEPHDLRYLKDIDLELEQYAMCKEFWEVV